MVIEEIKREDKAFPIRLRKIKNPPEKIYVIGNKEILNQKGIAIVGSRNCTKEGIRNARFFAANIANSGFTIISGMAKGIDAAAHSRGYGDKSVKLLRFWAVDLMLFFHSKMKKYTEKLLKQVEQ